MLDCENCKYSGLRVSAYPCNVCDDHYFNKFEPKEKEIKTCYDCEHSFKLEFEEPCISCRFYSNFVKKVQEEVTINKDRTCIDIDISTAKTLYDAVKEEFEGLDAIYEDAIVHYVGEYGLKLLRDNKCLESCGIMNGRRLYALCDWNK